MKLLFLVITLINVKEILTDLFKTIIDSITDKITTISDNLVKTKKNLEESKPKDKINKLYIFLQSKFKILEFFNT